jgi:hypothetical protein
MLGFARAGEAQHVLNARRATKFHALIKNFKVAAGD